MKEWKKNWPDIVGNREPRAAKQSVVSNPIENGSAPPVPPFVATHSQVVLRQGSSPARVLLLAHEPALPQMLLGWGWPRRGGEAAAAGEDEEEEGEEEGVDEDEGGPESLEERNYAVAGPRRERLHLRLGGRHGSRRRFRKQTRTRNTEEQEQNS